MCNIFAKISFVYYMIHECIQIAIYIYVLYNSFHFHSKFKLKNP